MNCREIRLLFSDYYDQELSCELRAVVKDHMVGCPDCSLEFEGFKKGIKLLRKFKSLDSPAHTSKKAS
jgi:predicted anti-sigma-YlaC factor YlaD